MESSFSPAKLREVLDTDVTRAVTELAEYAGRHANDRKLAYRAILLKRELSLRSEPPTAQQARQASEILEALIADRDRGVEHERRDVVAEQARSRALAMDVPNAVVLECVGLTKHYRRTSFTLSDVSLEARYGEIIGVVGRNGNGKTTLFRLLVGELRPTSGAVNFPAIQPDGGPVRWPVVGQQIAYVPQDLPPWYGSLKANLHYEAAVHRTRGKDNEREVEYIIERLGLTTELGKRWHELAGGYKLRFALARALVWKPKLMILDEPLANLDLLAQQVVLNDLRHLTDSLRHPLSILVSSQHVHEIEEVSDKLLLLTQGAVTYFGPVESIGATRRVNRFELSGYFELPDLQRALAPLNYLSIYYSGVAFVVTTPISVTARQVLQALLTSNVPVTFFRDISQSAVSLLQDDGLAE